MDDNIGGTYFLNKLTTTERNDELVRLRSQALRFQEREIQLLSSFNLPSAGRLLDMGCGLAHIAEMIARRFPDLEVTGIDESEDLLSRAKARIEDWPKNLKLNACDARNTNLSQASFDFVYCRFLLQHLSDPLIVLGEAMRLLKPGGQILLADIDDSFLSLYPEPDSFTQLKSSSAQKQAEFGGDRYIGRKLPSLLMSAGFSKVRTHLEGISSTQIGLDSFCNLAFSFRTWSTSGAETSAIYERFIAELKVVSETPVGIVGIIFAGGKK